MKKKSFFIYWMLFIIVDIFFVLSWIGISSPVEHQIGKCHIRFSKTIMPAWLKCKIKNECKSEAQKEAIIEKEKMLRCLCLDQEKEAEMITKYYRNEVKEEDLSAKEICENLNRGFRSQ